MPATKFRALENEPFSGLFAVSNSIGNFTRVPRQAEREGSEQTVVLQDFRRVFLADEHGGQSDDRLQFFAVEELYRLSQALCIWRSIEQCRGELTFVDPGNAFIGQSVDDELDVLVTLGVLGGEIGAVRLRTVVARRLLKAGISSRLAERLLRMTDTSHQVQQIGFGCL